MQKFKAIFSLMLILLASNFAYSSTPSQMLDELPEKYKSHQLTLLLPIQVDKKISLSVGVPKDFKKLTSPSDIMEFIPETDKDPYKWSQIIAISTFIGNGLSAEQIVGGFINLRKQKNDTVQLIDSVSSERDGVKSAGAVLLYMENGRQELLEIISFSGSYDSALVQNAVPTNGNIDKARDKLDQFFLDNVRLIHGSEYLR
jgi:hypothetical protein